MNEAKNISHFIIELSDTFVEADHLIGVFGDVSTYEIRTLKNAEATGGKEAFAPDDPGNSNPNLPAAMPGIKVNLEDPFETSSATFYIVTNRDPVWGDFYVKDGTVDNTDVTLWNEGFLDLDPADPPSSGTVNNHLLVPDTGGTQIIPEPTSLVGLLSLGCVGLLALGYSRRRRQADC
jgi:hypothetical protein